MRNVSAIALCGVMSFLTLVSTGGYAQSDAYAGSSPATYANSSMVSQAPVVSADSTSMRPESPDAVYMAVDLITRPVMFAVALAGTGVYILSLPFSFLGGNSEQARQELVVKPFQETFQRCLGCDGSMDTGQFTNSQ